MALGCLVCLDATYRSKWSWTRGMLLPEHRIAFSFLMCVGGGFMCGGGFMTTESTLLCFTEELLALGQAQTA